jgi:C-terminal processing protease CtpA/Prc
MTRARARSRSLCGYLLALSLVLGSVANWISVPAAAQDAGGVTTITGSLTLDIAADPLMYMGLVDLTGFVRRDFDYVQGDSLIAGWIDHATGGYRIELPAAPSGPFNDVGHGQGSGPGVQIYSVDPIPNLIGDDRLSPWEWAGWSWANSSIVTVHGTHEVTGGSIAVWAPDDAQQFPTDFGADGKLFTDDDPIGSIAAGWTVVDLDERPFAHNRSSQVDVVIEPSELAPVDLSQLSATAAFDQLVEVLRARYPFADSRPIDWDEVHATYRPEFEAAEQSGEQVDFWLALNHFLIALHNWAYFAVYPWVDYFATIFLGSTGLHVDVTDDGKVIVAKVDPGQAAEQAGILAGAEIVTWDGKPARQAVDDVVQRFTESSPQTALSQKTQFFSRAPSGTTIHVEYRNPGADTIVATDLLAVEIPGEDIGRAAGCYSTWEPCDGPRPPIWVEYLPSKIAVLHVRMFTVGLQEGRMLVDEWEQALQMLNNFPDAQGLIIDLRHADALSWISQPLYMAGSFFDEPFPLADVTQVDDHGNQVNVGTITINPAPIQWDRPIAILVDEWCKNSCEYFVQALTHRPDTIIAGMTATGGSLSATMESVLLPTGNFVLVVDTAFRDPVTHEVLVEGKGIEPTLRVPKTAESIVANVTSDLVRNAAEQALLDQIAAAEATPAS